MTSLLIMNPHSHHLPHHTPADTPAAAPHRRHIRTLSEATMISSTSAAPPGTWRRTHGRESSMSFMRTSTIGLATSGGGVGGGPMYLTAAEKLAGAGEAGGDEMLLGRRWSERSGDSYSSSSSSSSSGSSSGSGRQWFAEPADDGLPEDLAKAILFFRKSEVRTGHTERIYHLCSRTMVAYGSSRRRATAELRRDDCKAASDDDQTNEKIPDDLVRLQNLFDWRREQRLKVDWFLFAAHLHSHPDAAICLTSDSSTPLPTTPIKFASWLSPVPRTFQVEKIVTRLFAYLPELQQELRPATTFSSSADDHRAFPLDARYLEYREPILQLAKRIADREIELEAVVELVREKHAFAFGVLSHESLQTMAEQLRMLGRRDYEDELWQRRRS